MQSITPASPVTPPADPVSRGRPRRRPGRLIDLLATFGSFSRPGTGGRPDLSDEEELDVRGSSEDELTRLARVAARYERRFGFQPVVDARGHTAGEIADLVEQVITRDAREELERARAAAGAIYAGRLRARRIGCRP